MSVDRLLWWLPLIGHILWSIKQKYIMQWCHKMKHTSGTWWRQPFWINCFCIDNMAKQQSLVRFFQSMYVGISLSLAIEQNFWKCNWYYCANKSSPLVCDTEAHSHAILPAMRKFHVVASVYTSFVFLQGIPATVDGMLGGFSRLSGTDIASSKKFLLPFLQASFINCQSHTHIQPHQSTLLFLLVAKQHRVDLIVSNKHH